MNGKYCFLLCYAMSKMFFLFEEFAGGFQLVAHNAEEFAAFLKDVKVDE